MSTALARPETSAFLAVGATLSPRQRAAVAVLLEGGTQEDAARAAKVNPRQVRRWLELAQFRLALDEGARAMLEQGARRLQAGAQEAARYLADVAAGRAEYKKGRARVAQIVIELGLKIIEAEEITAKLLEVEARLGGGGGR